MTTDTINIESWAAQTFVAPTFDEHCIHDSDKNTFEVSLINSANPTDNIDCISVDGTNLVLNLTQDETWKSYIRSRFDTSLYLVPQFTHTLGG